MNFSFVSSDELWRSQKGVNTLLDLHNFSDDAQPHPKIVNYHYHLSLVVVVVVVVAAAVAVAVAVVVVIVVICNKVVLSVLRRVFK